MTPADLRLNIPDASSEFDSGVARLDKLIERFKGDLQNGKNIDLPQDRDLLLQLYDRLFARHRSFATDNFLADEILHLLNEEIMFDSGICNEALTDKQKAYLDEKYKVPQRMAQIIIKIVEEGGKCHPGDLTGKGFTPAEIERYWRMAYALASVVLDANGIES